MCSSAAACLRFQSVELRAARIASASAALCAVLTWDKIEVSGDSLDAGASSSVAEGSGGRTAEAGDSLTKRAPGLPPGVDASGEDASSVPPARPFMPVKARLRL